MQAIEKLLDSVRTAVRRFMRTIAVLINKLSGGKISPNSITLVGLGAHVIIAWLIAMGHFDAAAVLLIFFGLFDTLDGELARLQKRDSASGMLLDASTDRMKEVLLYMGVAYSFTGSSHPYMSVWAVLACGASLSVSYVKAKAETAVAKSNLSTSEVNRLFQDGLMRFEVRMAVLVIGLLCNLLAPAIILIAVLSTFTAIQRLIKITNKLNV